MRHSMFAVSLLAAALSLAACKPASFTAPQGAVEKAEAAPAAAQAKPAADAATLADDNLNAVLWVQASAEYRAAAETVYRAAADTLDLALKERHWDALVPTERDNAGNTAHLKPAVIMDVDETVLDNSPYQARLIRDQAQYSDPTWDLWVAEKKAKAVPGVVEFAKAAAAKGVTILYLSNRAVHLKDATIANLEAVGMPVASDDVFLGLGTVVPGCDQSGSEKNCRRRLAGREYRVLMQFGDQLGDFVEVVANTPQGRAGLLDEYGDWFGERWWMLPNPTYGGWEPALFNNDWALPTPERRQIKREALDFADQ
ncbi:5'-nucleotidase, lipoprotein e(P4) family [Luteimonas mephitis]|uniref:5'-nucleotidase, lipoprotein e(P4) family n=1 Tax=Luteimonas mephitis TaxID=83615 RepID=UPI003A8E0ECD